MKWILSTCLIAFCLGFLCCWLLFIYGSKPKIEIIEKVVHKTEYVQIPHTLPEYDACYKSPIHIDMKINDDIIQIFANDKCKRAEAEMRYSVGQSSNFKYYIGGAFAAGLLVAILAR